MDININPFSPNAGTLPPVLAGRQSYLDQGHIAFHALKHRSFAKSFLFPGLRGTGKTVLLNELESIALKKACQPMHIEGRQGQDLAPLLIPYLRQILLQISPSKGLQINKSAWRALKSFANAVRVKYKSLEVRFEFDVDPEPGVADSGDLEIDLPMLFMALGKALKEAQTALVLILDEMQTLTNTDLSALIMSLHRMAQKQLPIILIGAGLPQLKYLVGESKSYSERLFNFLDVGPLSKDDTAFALQKPLQKLKAQFSPSALNEVIKQTRGYPFFVQEWGYQAWNLSPQPTIQLNTVHKATQQALKSLDSGFFSVRFDRLAESEKKYLQAMATLGPMAHKSGAIANTLNKKTKSVSTVRDSLIRKNIIYSPTRGYTTFTVPLFDQFIQRSMGGL